MKKGYTKYIPFFYLLTLKFKIMAESKSTDKLMAMTMILDKVIDKLTSDKVEKIKTLEITWKTIDDNGSNIDHPLPELKLSFHS